MTHVAKATASAWISADRATGLRFEVEGLDAFCKALEKKGVKFDQIPKDMPWGWKHAYLRDPDGHKISLYWAQQHD